MPEEEHPNGDRIARVSAFVTLGILNVTQELIRRCAGSIDALDPELAAEETLCLVSTASSRAAGVGLRAEPAVAAAVTPVLLDVPFLYRDYLLGAMMLERKDAALVDTAEAIYARMQRKASFYGVHFPAGTFPGARLLRDKMALWMGRISPPKLPESPDRRLEKLTLVPLLADHLRLVLTYGRGGEAGRPAP